MPELEPVTLSEVGTKLDLARAYMDMGDPDGARSILEEVLAEGSASQKTEAQRLLETLPG
jgi:pilus assembly protein FimV